MEWIDVNNKDIEIPFTKVCVWDGANTFWAYLQKIEIIPGTRILHWNVIKPDNYGECKPLYWMKINEPSVRKKIYQYKGKPYSIVEETKTKINGQWVDSIIYKTLYVNPEGSIWVRTKEEFFSLFKEV